MKAVTELRSQVAVNTILRGLTNLFHWTTGNN